jgi:hypothetical protein
LTVDDIDRVQLERGDPQVFDLPLHGVCRAIIERADSAVEADPVRMTFPQLEASLDRREVGPKAAWD